MVATNTRDMRPRLQHVAPYGGSEIGSSRCNNGSRRLLSENKRML